ncbi:hypothetical protein OJAV_G00121520 [Oryzias javanicus]|uniref:Secreted protein n=1 Tax=Oryzias javanicus TaxID=123683 RepID=A0A3S2P6S8_ORYJA|nr:hypothetical protein OJAV_G00121520 [Oryzias javanicus]
MQQSHLLILILLRLQRKTAMTDWLRSASIKNRRPKHSMSHCQVPSCLALGLSWSLCVKSLCFFWYRSVCLLVVAVVETGRFCLWACGGCVSSFVSVCEFFVPKSGKIRWKRGICPSSAESEMLFYFVLLMELSKKKSLNCSIYQFDSSK